ncbi:MAG TPA: RNA polymerase sigma factor [Burkholderiales bacterium]|jgi:RNA polymerase sigma-70 factor (ECF subfamily)
MKPQPSKKVDARAFEQIMRQHNRMLFRTARAILRDDAEAEDALQEAYVQAYHALGSFRGEAKLSTWLARIVANEALMRLRKQTRRAEIVPIQPAAGQELEQVTDTNMHNAPDASAERKEVRALLEAQIDALPDAYRTVFMLRAVEELPVEEVSAILQIPPATVRTRYFRARSLLREALAQKIDLACEDAFSFAGARCDRIVAHVLARINPSKETP